MADKFDDKGESVLRRWSRLKRSSVRDDVEAPRRDDPPAEAGNAGAVVPAAAEDTEPAQPPADLPDIESLDSDSDYSVFLQDGVSEEIRRKALRVLWRSDPILANLDGLNDYDEDFATVTHVAEAVRTAYRAGKGYRDDAEVDETKDVPSDEPSDASSDAFGHSESGADRPQAPPESGESSTAGQIADGEDAAGPSTDKQEEV